MSRTRALTQAARAPRSMALSLVVLGGGAVALGAWLPWMTYFGGLVPLRGVIGLNGRVLFATGIAGVALAGVMAWSAQVRTRTVARRANTLLGIAAVSLATWASIGVRELTRIHAGNAMLAPRAGAGLAVVVVGGLLLTLSTFVHEQ